MFTFLLTVVVVIALDVTLVDMQKSQVLLLMGITPMCSIEAVLFPMLSFNSSKPPLLMTSLSAQKLSNLVVTSMRKFPTLYVVLLIVVLEFQ